MRLRDIHSALLLPEFSEKAAFLQDGFDILIKSNIDRIPAIDAPLTLESIEALTDEELQAFYAEYGIAEYYPDLSRETRNQMLFWMSKLWRFMGTPAAVEILCKYIFDDLDLSLTITDNLAFDSNGALVDVNSLDLFDVTIEPSTNSLPADAIQRIEKNVLNFARNSQTIRNLVVLQPETNIDCTVYDTSPYDDVMALISFENDAICENVQPPTPESMPSFAVLDSTTGEVVHTSNIGQVGYIPFTQTYKIANIAHTGFISFNQLFRVPDDSMRFIEEPPQPSYNTAYFNPGQGNDQMPTDTSWGSLGGQIELLYFHNSSERVPYDSSKSYTVRSVFYVDGTEVTDEDLAPKTVSQYVEISDLNYMGQHTGTLILRTLANNPIYGKPCGCTYIEESLS